MKSIFSIFIALTFMLAAGSAVFADDTIGSPDTLQKHQGPGNIDATTKAWNKVPAPTPPPVPQPKVPPMKRPASSGY